MQVSLIAAMSQNRVIGKNGTVPWHLPDDLEWLKERIAGRYLLMGRKTFEEPQQELLSENTIVVTTQKGYKTSGAHIVHNIEEGIALCKKLGEIELMVVGGAKIYDATLLYADNLYLTVLKTEIEGDTFFPVIDNKNRDLTYQHFHPRDEQHQFAFDFKILKRKIL